MGSEDIFKRKAKKARDLQRRLPVRQAYQKVLIVCEGRKTEPFYFTELKDYYEISTANIRISGECGSDPMSVVRHGEALYREAIRSRDEQFDRVYCVFDRDQHQNYLAALSYIGSLKPIGVFYPIVSVPSFEVWFLLHFRFATAPYSANGGKSAGDYVMSELKRYWPEYTKGLNSTFTALLPQLEQAKIFAQRLNLQSTANGSSNPTTYVHELVDYLQKIKEFKRW